MNKETKKQTKLPVKTKPTIKKKSGRLSVSDKLAQIEKREMIAIQGITDPRRRKFASGYMDQESKTYGNAKQSMIAAGFSEDYADNITHLRPRWFTEIIGQDDIVAIAMMNLREDVSMSIFQERVIGKTMVKVFDKDAGKHRRDQTQFALKNLHSKFKGNADDNSGQQGVFQGAIVRNININYTVPSAVEHKQAEYEDQRSEGEIINVQAQDVTFDFDKLLKDE